MSFLLMNGGTPTRHRKKSPDGKIALMAHLEDLPPGLDQATPPVLAANQIKQLIQTLDSCRHLWRGDVLEVRLLVALKNLYKQSQDGRSALRALITLQTFLGHYGDLTALRQEASDVFFQTLQQKKAAIDLSKNLTDTVKPLQYLGFYYEFDDMVPADERFLQVINDVANVLLALNLLDNAIALMQDRYDMIQTLATQGHFTPTQAEDNQNMARLKLAQLYLEKNQPDQALASLNQIHPENLGRLTPPASAPSGTEPVLSSQENYRLLNAQALMRLERKTEALAALEGATSAQAFDLRLRLMMDLEQWPQVSATLEQALASNQKKDDQVRNMVLSLAIAYTQHGDHAKALALHDPYKELFAKNPQEPVFQMLTTQDQEIPMGKESLLNQVKTTDDMLKNLRKSVFN
jgi:tetratricopeptide (TPR) repeat protein